MANLKQINILKQGKEAWNEWRDENKKIKPDLREADLLQTNLTFVNLTGVNLTGANLYLAKLDEANLSGAYLQAASLTSANLTRANLSGADLTGSNLLSANLSDSNLRGADLTSAKLDSTDFSGADLSRADLTKASLIETNFDKANLTDCWIYGISAWNLNLNETIQSGLIISEIYKTRVTVDDVEMAQFIYLLINNQKIRNVIDTVTSKVVLILGRFYDERKSVLDALRDRLRKKNFVPIIFDFKPSDKRDLTETIQLLANMAKFVIADLTDAKSIPQELSSIVPHLPSVPIKPILLVQQKEYSMFEHWREYDWVLNEFYYENEGHLLKHLDENILKSVDDWKTVKEEKKYLKEKIRKMEKLLEEHGIENP